MGIRIIVRSSTPRPYNLGERLLFIIFHKAKDYIPVTFAHPYNGWLSFHFFSHLVIVLTIELLVAFFYLFYKKIREALVVLFVPLFLRLEVFIPFLYRNVSERKTVFLKDIIHQKPCNSPVSVGKRVNSCEGAVQLCGKLHRVNRFFLPVILFKKFFH